MPRVAKRLTPKLLPTTKTNNLLATNSAIEKVETMRRIITAAETATIITTITEKAAMRKRTRVIFAEKPLID